MRRREFIQLGTIVLGSCFSSLGRGAEPPRRIGVLIGSSNTYIKEFDQQLEKLGWINGRNVQIEYRFPPSRPELIQSAAKGLVAWQPDVVLALSTPEASALKPRDPKHPHRFRNGG